MHTGIVVPVFDRFTFDTAVAAGIVPDMGWPTYLALIDEAVFRHLRRHEDAFLQFVSPIEFLDWCDDHLLDPSVPQNLSKFGRSEDLPVREIIGSASASIVTESYLSLLRAQLPDGHPPTILTGLLDRAEHLLDVVSAFVDPELRVTVFTRYEPTDESFDGCAQMTLYRESVTSDALPDNPGDGCAFLSALALACVTGGYLMIESEMDTICPETDTMFRMLRGWEISSTVFRPLSTTELAGLDWDDMSQGSGVGPGPDVILSGPGPVSRPPR